jgi:hypothetical protein
MAVVEFASVNAGEDPLKISWLIWAANLLVSILLIGSTMKEIMNLEIVAGRQPRNKGTIDATTSLLHKIPKLTLTELHKRKSDRALLRRTNPAAD